MSVRVTVRRPAPPLAPFVDQLWHCETALAHARERIVPQAAMQLLVNLEEDELRHYDGDGYARAHRMPGAAMCGAMTRHFAIDTAEQRLICGASFRPGGGAALFGAPADEARDRHVALADAWGAVGAGLRARLLDAGPDPHAVLDALERVLLERLRAARDPAPDPAIAFALGALDGGAQVGAVTDRLGMSPARFIRRFAAAVGLTPKRYARLQRFDRVLHAVDLGRAIDWARVALDCGYFDQAHLIHDFREFSGVCPTAYVPRMMGDRHHTILR
jgi:AraC-like DNA-binding protein